MSIVTPEEVSAWVGRTLTDPVDADAIEQVTDAVNAFVPKVIAPYPDPPPEDLRLAVLLLASRWYSRRNSPDGLVGFGELGASSIRSIDPDIRDMLKTFQSRNVG